MLRIWRPFPALFFFLFVQQGCGDSASTTGGGAGGRGDGSSGMGSGGAGANGSSESGSESSETSSEEELDVLEWEEMGLVEDVDQLYTLAHVAGTWYASTFDAGILVSTDSGATWDSLPSGPSLAFDAFAFDGRLYAAGQSSGKQGVFVSPDDGESWTLDSNSMFSGNDIPVSFGTDGNVLLAGGQQGIVATLEPGGSWTERTDIGSFLVSDFATFDSSLYLASQDGTLGGVYRSTDGGKNWELVNTGLAAVNGILRAQEIEATEDAMFVDAVGQFYRTTNGKNWERHEPDLLPGPLDAMRTSSRTLVGINSGVFATSNGGKQWIDLTANLPAGDYDTLGIGGGEILVSIREGSEGHRIYRRNL